VPMATPQQPELHRSGRGSTDPKSAKTTATTLPLEGSEGTTGPVPEDNQPGHHPETEQDKPAALPKRRPAARRAPKPKPKRKTKKPAPAPERTTFGFAFDSKVAPLSFALGVTPWTARVELVNGDLVAHFGPWTVRAALEDVEDATVTGPYTWAKVVGPPRISFADRGLTFATTTERGVCIRFRKPVRGSEPTGVLRHPSLTVTVEDPETLVEALERRTG
jgi:hypothetical protein